MPDHKQVQEHRHHQKPQNKTQKQKVQSQNVVKQMTVPQVHEVQQMTVALLQTIQKQIRRSEVMSHGVLFCDTSLPRVRGRAVRGSRRLDGPSAILGDLPSALQRHAVMVQTAQGTAEVPMLQFVDKVVNIPVVVQQQIPKAQTTRNTMEISQVLCIEKVVDVFVVRAVQATRRHLLEKMITLSQIAEE